MGKDDGRRDKRGQVLALCFDPTATFGSWRLFPEYLCELEVLVAGGVPLEAAGRKVLERT